MLFFCPFSLFLGGCWWCLLRSLVYVWWFVDVFFGIYAGLCYYFAGGFVSVLFVCLFGVSFIRFSACLLACLCVRAYEDIYFCSCLTPIHNLIIIGASTRSEPEFINRVKCKRGLSLATY